MIRNLTDLGMGKRDTMEAIIDQESAQLVERLRANADNVVASKVKAKLKYKYSTVEPRHL